MFKPFLVASFSLALAGCGQPEAGVGGGPVDPMPMPMPIANAPVPSALAADQQAAGLDLHALPALNALSHPQLKAVMKSFTVALGVSCTGCHTQGDFAAPTPEKNVAARMWSDFTGGLELADGSPVYCDSCHQGKAAFLDRSDPHALAQFMKAAFVDGLHRKDGQPNSCKTCHGDPFDPSFLETWKKG